MVCSFCWKKWKTLQITLISFWQDSIYIFSQSLSWDQWLLLTFLHSLKWKLVFWRACRLQSTKYFLSLFTALFGYFVAWVITIEFPAILNLTLISGLLCIFALLFWICSSFSFLIDHSIIIVSGWIEPRSVLFKNLQSFLKAMIFRWNRLLFGQI